MIVLFTHRDDLEHHGKSLAAFTSSLPEKMKGVLSDCGNRYLAFDNRVQSTSEKQAQVTELLMMIDQMVAVNEGRCYTYDVYKEFAEMICDRERKLKADLKRKQDEETRRIQAQVEKDTKNRLKEIEDKARKEEEKREMQARERERVCQREREQEKERKFERERIAWQRKVEDLERERERERQRQEQRQQDEIRRAQEQARAREKEQKEKKLPCGCHIICLEVYKHDFIRCDCGARWKCKRSGSDLLWDCVIKENVTFHNSITCNSMTIG